MSKNPRFIMQRDVTNGLFPDSEFLLVSKAIIKKYGLDLAVFIGNLVDKNERNGFFLTHADQTEQIGLSDYQLRKCKQKCRELDILTTKMVGIPPKEYYFLNMEALASFEEIDSEEAK